MSGSSSALRYTFAPCAPAAMQEQTRTINNAEYFFILLFLEEFKGGLHKLRTLGGAFYNLQREAHAYYLIST